MPDEKITILGGGSPFVPSIIHAILENRETLDGSEVCLMDINPSRLPALTKLGEELSRRRKANVKFTWTTDPKKALDGATFVMPGYRIGGLKHMKYDIEIPTKHGICGDETTGPGGTFMAQCTIPATIEYCRMMEDLCPDAWAISYVNPASIVADAVRRETKVRFISICDCYAGFSMSFLPRVLNMPPFERRYCVNGDIRARAIGVNHLTWLVDLQVNGEDGYPLLRKQLGKYKGKLSHDRPLDLMLRLFEAYGYVNVCPYHVRVYWDYDLFLNERKEGVPHEEAVLGWSESRWKFVEEMLGGAEYEQHPSEYCFELYHARQAVGILVSILTDEGREWGGINFPNTGIIPNLPNNSIVEGQCTVDRRGLTPIPTGDLPKPFLGLTQHIINWQELTADAALSGDKDLLYQALMACPYVHDMNAAKVILDELLEAHAEYMPQFKK
jgi:alpha-galactosidase/6-phospho-beta-glucosidase family protein